MWNAFTLCYLLGLLAAIWQNMADPKKRLNIGKGIQQRRYGGMLLYFLVTSSLYGIAIFTPFYLLNLVFHWVG